MIRLFLDTNIVLDLLAERKPFCDDAVRLFTLAHEKKVELFVSPVTFTTASYVLSKHNAAEERKLLSGLRQLVRIANTADRTIDDGLSCRFTDVQDTLQYYLTLTIIAEAIITRSGKEFANPHIPVISAVQWLGE